MSWEIESEELDLAEFEHRTHFVERNVTTRSGEPARHILIIPLKDGKKTFADFTLNEKGEILDAEGKVYDHRAKQQSELKNLNDLHLRGRAFAQKNHVQLAKGPKK
jgi:hypothetical protein